MEVHHKTPKHINGNDKYDNLVFVSDEIHKLIHATNRNTIEKYLQTLGNIQLDYERLNSLRKLVGNCDIDYNK